MKKIIIYIAITSSLFSQIEKKENLLDKLQKQNITYQVIEDKPIFFNPEQVISTPNKTKTKRKSHRTKSYRHHRRRDKTKRSNRPFANSKFHCRS